MIEIGHGRLQGLSHQRAEGMAADNPLKLMAGFELAAQGLETGWIRVLLLRLVPVQAWGLVLGL